MKLTFSETIKKLSLTSFTIERQTTSDDINTLLSPIYEECITSHLRKSGYPDIYSWNIKLQKRPIKEIGYYTVKVSLSSDPKDNGEIKLWVVPAPYEAKEKPKPSGFPKYYRQKNGLTTRKFYRVDSEWSATKKDYNAVWVDAEGKERRCAIYSGDYPLFEEISREKAMSLILSSSRFPYYLIPAYTGSMFAYWRIDSADGGIGFCCDGTTNKCPYLKPDSSSKLVSRIEAEDRLKKSPTVLAATATKKGISIKEAVRQLEAEGKVYVTYGRGRMPLFDNTNAVRVIMGAYKAASSRRGRVSLKEALRWAKNL